MRISFLRPGGHSLVLQCILLMSIARSSLAGMEVFYDGKKFFYRHNGRNIPIKFTPGSEVTRLEEDYCNELSRKTRDTFNHYRKSGILDGAMREKPDPWTGNSFTILSEFMEYPEYLDQEGEAENLPSDPMASTKSPTRYEFIARLINTNNMGPPEDRIKTVLQIIRDEIQQKFFERDEVKDEHLRDGVT